MTERCLYWVCTIQRSGGGWFADLMNNSRAGYPLEHLNNAGEVDRPSEPTLEYYARRILNHRGNEGRLVGCKIDIPALLRLSHEIPELHQATAEGVIRALDAAVRKEDGGKWDFPHYIYLYRFDTIAQAMSTVAALRTNTWHWYPGAPPPPEVKVEPSGDDVKAIEERNLKQHRSWMAVLSATRHWGAPYLPLAYEQLEIETYATLQVALDYLDHKLGPNLHGETRHQMSGYEQLEAAEREWRRRHHKVAALGGRQYDDD